MIFVLDFCSCLAHSQCFLYFNLGFTEPPCRHSHLHRRRCPRSIRPRTSCYHFYAFSTFTPLSTSFMVCSWAFLGNLSYCTHVACLESSKPRFDTRGTLLHRLYSPTCDPISHCLFQCVRLSADPSSLAFLQLESPSRIDCINSLFHGF